jgi:hypothetical protein
MNDALLPPLFILTLAAMGAAPSVWLAHRNGRSMVLWGGLGIFLPVLSLLFLVLVGRKKEVLA